MRIVASKHAAARMQQRNITWPDVQNVIGAPMITVNRADGCVEYVGVSAGRRLKVVLNERQNPAVLVTVFEQT